MAHHLFRNVLVAAALSLAGCSTVTVPLANLTGSGEQPWVWPYFLGGQPTVVAFWTTDEMQCLRDVPALKTLDAREGDVQLVTVVTGRDRREIDKWLRRERIGYPVLLDLDERLAGQLRVHSCPTFIYYDARGEEIGRASDIRVAHNWFDRERWLQRSGAIARGGDRDEE